jgi:hypothetical protein
LRLFIFIVIEQRHIKTRVCRKTKTPYSRSARELHSRFVVQSAGSNPKKRKRKRKKKKEKRKNLLLTAYCLRSQTRPRFALARMRRFAPAGFD